MHRGMATCRPTSAIADQRAVIHVADIETGAGGWALGLGVAFKAQIGVPLHQHFGVDGAVRVMADGATFPHRGVFENHGARLFPMALGAILVEPRHGESARGFHDVHPVGIVALHAAHFAFNDRVMLREMKFRAGFLVALEAAFGIFSGVDDEFFETAAARHGDVLTAGAVAGFAAALAGHIGNGET